MKRLIFLILILCVVAISRPAYAAVLRSSDSVTIPSSQTINDDMYVAGGTVTVNGRINGDLIATGGNIVVNGPVRDDIMVAGGSVLLNGQVGQSVRAAGGNMSITGDIGEDLVITGGTVSVSNDATIGRDVIVGVGTAVLSGPIGRNLRGGGGQITIDTRVGGDVTLDVDDLTLTDRADINGDLTYTSDTEATIEEGARVRGETTRKEPPVAVRAPSPGERTALSIVYFVLSFIAAFVFGLLLLLLFPTGVSDTAGAVRTSPWVSLLLGLAVLIVTPIAALILLILVITIPIGLTSLFLYALGIYTAKIFVGLALGRAIFGYFKRETGNILALLVGLLIIMLLGVIPILGGFVRFVYIILGLGAVSLIVYRAFSRRPSAPQTPPETQQP